MGCLARAARVALFSAASAVPRGYVMLCYVMLCYVICEAVVGPLALAKALAALLRERVGALVHPVPLVRAYVPDFLEGGRPRRAPSRAQADIRGCTSP